MKKFLLMMMLCVMSVVGAWAQGTQASSSVYKFTDKAADGGLYTDDHGTAASVTSGAVCNLNYFVKSEYKKSDSEPSTESITAFGVKTYYVKGPDSYTCAYGTAYNAANTYATVVSPVVELTGDALNDKLSTVWRWSASAVNYGIHKKVNEELVPVEEGEEINLSANYWPNKTNTSWTVTGNDLKSWGDPAYGIQKSNFLSTEGIYTKVGEIYIPLSTNDYDSEKHYYTLVFSDLDETAEAAMAAEVTNFETTTTLVGLSTPNSDIYYFDGVSYTEANNGDVYHAGCYYIKEDSYAEKTPAELLALGYVSAETTLYKCDVAKEGNTVTISYDYNKSYGTATKTLIEFIQECPTEISGFENVVIKSNDTSHATIDNISNILTGINGVTGITNLVLDEIANNGILSYNLSGLTNPAVKRVILPTVGSNNDDYSDISSKVASISATNVNVIMEVVAYHGTGDNAEYRCFVHTPVAGGLEEIKDAHYYSDNISRSTRQVYSGNINADDIAWFDGVNVSQLDLSAINTSDAYLDGVKAALHVLKNDNIEYVVFPDLKVKPEDPLYTEFLEEDHCPNVIAVGQYTSTDKTFNAYSKQVGKISILTDMLADLTNKNALIENVKLSGNLNAHDLNGGATVIDPETGHLGVYKTSYDNQGWTAKDGVTPVGSGALNGVQLHDVNLKDAYFEVPEDMTLAAFGILKAENAGYNITVEMPTDSRMTTVPPCFLEKIRDIHEICVPENYTIVKAGAFYQCGISHINTTKGGEVLDYGETAWTLSSTLELIEKGAFWTNVTGGVTDVYALRYEPTTSVPVTVCQMNSFPSGMYYGWGGFAGNTAHPIQRSNYKNNDFYFTILHYPAGMPDVQRAKYTDITRQYSFFDETGATDDDGLLYRWPSMEQFYRAYNQAVAGVTWDAWWQSNQIIESYAAVHEWSGDQYIEQLPVTEGKAYKFDPTTDTSITYRPENDETSGWKDGWWNPSEIYFSTPSAQESTVPYLSSPATSYDNLAEKYKYDIDNFAGWHQFVLVGSTNYEHIDDPDPDPYWDFAKYKDNDWYTICLPFSLTKAELTKIFGNPDYSGSDEYTYKYPDVRSLAGVTRDVPGKHVLIQLSDNLMKQKLLREDDGSPMMTTSGVKLVPVYESIEVSENEIVIEADKPYFIKPILPEKEKEIANAGRRAIQYSKKDADALIATHVPNVTIHVNARNANETMYLDWQDTESAEIPAQPYKYYFLGNYIPQIMPMHAYYLGVKGGKSTIFRNSKSNRSWTTYNCVMGAIANEKTSVSIKGQGVEGKVENSIVEFKNEDDFTFSRKDDGKGEHAAKASFMFEFTDEEGTATGLMQMNANGSMTFIKDNAPVYSINGQVVGCSIQNLPSGVYIVNGKKYIK